MQVIKVFIFFLLLVQQGFSQELKDQFDYAHSLFQSENYFDAVTEFKRLLFFDEGKEYSYSANMLIGQSYKMGGKFSDAIYFFALAGRSSISIEQRFNSKIEVIKCNILRRTTQLAHSLLNELEKEPLFHSRKKNINYWRGWAFAFSGEWRSAAASFAESENKELEKFALNAEGKMLSVSKAKIFSIIIPGAGQIYSGNYLNGFISFGWNLLSGYLAINAFIEDRIFDGLAITNFLWLRFYLGNIQNAEKFAEEKNAQLSNETLEAIRINYKGEKPENFSDSFSH
jgi:hypothetical protein